MDLVELGKLPLDGSWEILHAGCGDEPNPARTWVRLTPKHHLAIVVRGSAVLVPARRHLPEDVVPVDLAVACLKAVAFTIGEEYEGAGQVIVHTFAGPFGADWKLDDAIAAVTWSTDRRWVRHMMDHNLAVVHEGKVRYFDVPGPWVVR